VGALNLELSKKLEIARTGGGWSGTWGGAASHGDPILSLGQKIGEGCWGGISTLGRVGGCFILGFGFGLVGCFVWVGLLWGLGVVWGWGGVGGVPREVVSTPKGWDDQ